MYMYIPNYTICIIMYVMSILTMSVRICVMCVSTYHIDNNHSSFLYFSVKHTLR